jgi:hypothetical protein
MRKKDPQHDYYEKLERISNLKDKGLISDEEYVRELQKIEKSKPKPASKASRLIVGVILAIVFIYVLTIIVDALSGPSSSDIENNRIQTQEQARKAQEAAKERESTIKRLAPKYCEAHQRTKVTFEDADFPGNDGSGWTKDECKKIVSYLYDNSSTIGSVEGVIDSKIWVGMYATEVWYSLGNPDDINSTDYGSGITEQLVYSNSYVYIKDGVVTSYQLY